MSQQNTLSQFTVSSLVVLFKGGGVEGFTGVSGSHIVSSAETCSE
jgi:hypothetical protein